MKMAFILVLCVSACFFYGCDKAATQENIFSQTSNASQEIEQQEGYEEYEIISNSFYQQAVDQEAESLVFTDKEIDAILQKRIENGEVVELYNGVCLDLDGDLTGENLLFETWAETETDREKYALTIANRKISGEIQNGSKKFYGAMLGGQENGIQIIVDEDGPSGDPNMHIFHYEEKQIWNMANIYGTPQSIKINGRKVNSFVRGNLLETWYHEVTYVFSCADSLNQAEKRAFVPPTLTVVPPDMYAMGTIVELKKSLKLYVTKNSDKTFVLPKGALISLSASDDMEWIYIVPLEHCVNSSVDIDGGWLKMKLDSNNICIQDENEVDGIELFEGLNLWD